MITADYHMHTPLCGHASGEPEEYAKRAIEVGLKEIGFSDHAPMVHLDDPTVTMSSSQLPDYYKMIEEVQSRFKDQLRIKLAIEADFVPGYEEKTKAILNDYDFDYVIGSVHYIGDWGFDNLHDQELWNKKDVNSVYREYFEILRKSAQTGLYDIMGHVDLVKKFGHRATEDLTDEIEKTAECFKAAGVVIDVNTSGLRKPVGEIYPSLALLKIFAKVGVPITFGSDAHRPEEVGSGYDEALALVKEAGYKEYALFGKRKIEKTISL